MSLRRGHITSKPFTNPSSFHGSSFGLGAKMTAFMIDNMQGTKDCFLFGFGNQAKIIPTGTQSVWFTMPDGYYDTGEYSLSFDTNGNSQGVLVIAVIAEE